MDFCEWSDYQKWLESINVNLGNIKVLTNKNNLNKLEVYRAFMHSYPIGEVLEINGVLFRVLEYSLAAEDGEPAGYSAKIKSESGLELDYDLLDLINSVASSTTFLLSKYLSDYLNKRISSEDAIAIEMKSLREFTNRFKLQYPINSTIKYVSGCDESGSSIVKVGTILNYKDGSDIVIVHSRGIINKSTGSIIDSTEETKEFITVDLYQRITGAVEVDFDVSTLTPTNLIIGEGSGDYGVQYRLIIKDKQLGIKKLL